MKRAPKNMAASARARLLERAKREGADYNLVLTRYCGERLLYRLSRSDHAERFVLKGASLFVVWRGSPHRASRDVDLLGFGAPEPEALRATLFEVLAVEVEDDGIAFDATTLTVAPIRWDQAYGGIRATLVAKLGSAKIGVQVDVGFGDAITPDATWAELPTLLDLPAPRLRVYPAETVVAEKVEAMCQLGLANTRMKDFYDLVVISRMFEFDAALLARAVRATFDRRGTDLPDGEPVALTEVFFHDAGKQQQWRAFQSKAGGEDLGELPVVMRAVRELVLPVLVGDGPPPGSRWRDRRWRSPK